MTGTSSDIWQGKVRDEAIRSYGPNGVQVSKWLVSTEDYPSLVASLGWAEQAVRVHDTARRLASDEAAPADARAVARVTFVKDGPFRRLHPAWDRANAAARRTHGRDADSWFTNIKIDAMSVAPSEDETLALMEAYGIETIAAFLVLRPWMPAADEATILAIYGLVDGLQERIAALGEPARVSAPPPSRGGCAPATAAMIAVLVASLAVLS